MCLEVPAIGQVQRDCQQNDGTRNADLQRVFSDQYIGNDVADDDHQTERHAKQGTQSLPAADDENAGGKERCKPQKRTTANEIRKINGQRPIGTRAGRHQDLVIDLKIHCTRQNLPPAIIHLRDHTLVLPLQQFHPGNLISLYDPTQIDLALLHDRHHACAQGFGTHRTHAHIRQFHLSDVTPNP